MGCTAGRRVIELVNEEMGRRRRFEEGLASLSI